MTPQSAETPFVVLLAQLIEGHAGLHYGERDLETFAERARARALDAGFDSLVDYYYALRYDDPEHLERSLLVEALVIGETYFFREVEPLEVLVEWLKPRVERGSARVSGAPPPRRAKSR